MVETLKSLTKASTSKSLHNFVAIAYVILHNNLVVSTLVIIPVVVHQSWGAFNLLCLVAHKVNLGELKYFHLLVFSQNSWKLNDGLSSWHWKLTCNSDGRTRLLGIRVKRHIAFIVLFFFYILQALRGNYCSRLLPLANTSNIVTWHRLIEVLLDLNLLFKLLL